MTQQYLDESDMSRAAALLHIVEKCAGHSGKLGSLSNAAMSALLKINDGIKAKAIEDAEAERAEAARNRPKVIEPEPLEPNDGNTRPTVYPGDSQTATIADRRL